MVEIECFLSLGCGSEPALRDNIEGALKGMCIDAVVRFHRIEDSEAAKRGLGGSPTVFVNGREVEPAGAQGFS